MTKAFVLAAGLGKRLLPLTKDMPKPMLPILDKPILHHVLNLLKKNDFDFACVNLHYQSEIIKNYFKNKNLGFNLDFSVEKNLLGTAGAVKNKEELFDETFVIISGDVLTDINLKDAFSFHKKKKALITVILKDIDFKLEYGAVLTDKNSQIKSFIEKPLLADIFDSKINTGIYIAEPEIFEFIPENKPFDFSLDLFPLLQKNKQKIFGYKTNGYWKDAGCVKEYKKCVFDALDKKIKTDFINKDKKYIDKSVKIHKTAKICAPCFICNNVEIGENSIIKPYCVISRNSKIGKNVTLEKTIIFENSKIGNDSKTVNSIITAGQNVSMAKNLVLSNAIITK